ncbi:hypothetical protein ACJRO7_000712 [Eucalyptus globulus]|uniref:Scarecrow-like protein 8 n=1 Tax=Eucalyptus globulus TaxID=34317 RepID=A0ABD3LYB5_EUCGL
MERSALPKNLSASRKRAIQELCGQNPKKLRDVFDAHSQTGDDPRQPVFAEDLIVSVLGSFSNTQSLSSGTESYEVFQVPSNAFVTSEVSEGSESIRSPVESVKTPVQRSPVFILWKQSLVEAATAIYEGRVDVALEILRRLSAMPKPMGYSKQKLMEYKLSALKSHLSPVDNPPPVVELFTKDHALSVQSLYDISPCFKLGFMAANLAIAEAASEQPSANKLHVIDFDIGWEGQYLNLLHALSIRQAGNQSTLKFTTLADSFNVEERMVGDRVSELAAKMGVRLVFNIVRQKLSELSCDSLGCEADEVLVVNFAFKLYRMPDESVSAENTRDELLRCVKGLEPQVVTLVEQEMNGNTAPFPMLVEEALTYYGALLESFAGTAPRDDSDRVRAEEGLSLKLWNSVACEGRDRVERCEPLGRRVAEPLKGWIGSRNRVNPGYTAKEENGVVCLGWLDRTLTVASAWS